MAQDTLRQRAFSVLKKYGYLETSALQEYLYLIFGEHCKYHTARKYREEWEKNFVGLVVDVGTYLPFKNKSKRKEYQYNGNPFGKQKYKIPFFHTLRMLFKSKIVLNWQKRFYS